MKNKISLNEEKVWVFDNGSDIPSGPYDSEEEANKDIKIIMARNSSGEKNDCGKPYQMERSKLHDLVLQYMDESELNESMNDQEKKEFYAKLATEKVHFQYKKKDGSMRKAYGTLIPKELPPPKKSTDTKQEARDKLKKKVNPKQVFYYDLDEKGWRSFLMENFDKYLDEE